VWFVSSCHGLNFFLHFLFRSSDAQLLVVSSTDGYCTLITFDANELGTVYKKVEVVAPVSSPIKPVHQSEEQTKEVETPARKELSVIQTATVAQPSPVSDPMLRESSPQRKKARRVVLQTLSTNVAGFTNAPQNAAASGKTEPVSMNINSEKCRSADISSDMQCSGQGDDLCKKTINNCGSGSDREPESMDVSEDAEVAEVCIY